MNFRSLLAILAIIVSCLAFSASTKASVLYESRNTFGSKYVYENNGQVCLSFLKLPTRINQSCIYSERPDVLIFDYAKLSLSALFINPAPQKILNIGLGGGNIARALNKLVPSAYIEIVEIDPEIQVIAKQYFGFKESENIKVHIQDGYEFVSKAKSGDYDLIIIDAFTDDYVPESFLTKEFVGNIKRILSENGIVAVNTFGVRNEHYSLESKLYNEAFGKFMSLDSGCRVIIASKNEFPDKAKIKEGAEIWRNPFLQIGVSTDGLVNKF